MEFFNASRISSRRDSNATSANEIKANASTSSSPVSEATRLRREHLYRAEYTPSPFCESAIKITSNSKTRRYFQALTMPKRKETTPSTPGKKISEGDDDGDEESDNESKNDDGESKNKNDDDDETNSVTTSVSTATTTISALLPSPNNNTSNAKRGDLPPKKKKEKQDEEELYLKQALRKKKQSEEEAELGLDPNEGPPVLEALLHYPPTEMVASLVPCNSIDFLREILDEGLEPDDFVATVFEVFQKAYPTYLDNGNTALEKQCKSQLRVFFSEVDANDNGNVDWEEFSTHLLVNTRGAPTDKPSRAMERSLLQVERDSGFDPPPPGRKMSVFHLNTQPLRSIRFIRGGPPPAIYSPAWGCHIIAQDRAIEFGLASEVELTAYKLSSAPTPSQALANAHLMTVSERESLHTRSLEMVAHSVLAQRICAMEPLCEQSYALDADGGTISNQRRPHLVATTADERLLYIELADDPLTLMTKGTGQLRVVRNQYLQGKHNILRWNPTGRFLAAVDTRGKVKLIDPSDTSSALPKERLSFYGGGPPPSVIGGNSHRNQNNNNKTVSTITSNFSLRHKNRILKSTPTTTISSSNNHNIKGQGKGHRFLLEDDNNSDNNDHDDGDHNNNAPTKNQHHSFGSAAGGGGGAGVGGGGAVLDLVTMPELASCDKVICAGSDAIRMFDTARGGELLHMLGERLYATKLAYSSSTNLVAACIAEEPDIYLLSPHSAGKSAFVRSLHDPLMFSGTLRALPRHVIALEGTPYLTSFDSAGVVRLWDLRSSVPVCSFRSTGEDASKYVDTCEALPLVTTRAIAVDPVRLELSAVSRTVDGIRQDAFRMQLTDARDPRDAHDNDLLCVEFIEDMHQLASLANDDTLHFWDGETMVLRRRIKEFVNGDGETAAVPGKARRPVTACCIEVPNGRRTMIGLATGEVFMYSTVTRCEIAEFQPHQGQVVQLSLALSERLVSAGADGIIYISSTSEDLEYKLFASVSLENPTIQISLDPISQLIFALDSSCKFYQVDADPDGAYTMLSVSRAIHAPSATASASMYTRGGSAKAKNKNENDRPDTAASQNSLKTLANSPRNNNNNRTNSTKENNNTKNTFITSPDNKNQHNNNPIDSSSNALETEYLNPTNFEGTCCAICVPRAAAVVADARGYLSVIPTRPSSRHGELYLCRWRSHSSSGGGGGGGGGHGKAGGGGGGGGGAGDLRGATLSVPTALIYVEAELALYVGDDQGHVAVYHMRGTWSTGKIGAVASMFGVEPGSIPSPSHTDPPMIQDEFASRPKLLRHFPVTEANLPISTMTFVASKNLLVVASRSKIRLARPLTGEIIGDVVQGRCVGFEDFTGLLSLGQKPRKKKRKTKINHDGEEVTDPDASESDEEAYVDEEVETDEEVDEEVEIGDGDKNNDKIFMSTPSLGLLTAEEREDYRMKQLAQSLGTNVFAFGTSSKEPEEILKINNNNSSIASPEDRKEKDADRAQAINKLLSMMANEDDDAENNNNHNKKSSSKKKTTMTKKVIKRVKVIRRIPKKRTETNSSGNNNNVLSEDPLMKGEQQQTQPGSARGKGDDNNSSTTSATTPTNSLSRPASGNNNNTNNLAASMNFSSLQKFNASFRRMSQSVASLRANRDDSRNPKEISLKEEFESMLAGTLTTTTNNKNNNHHNKNSNTLRNEKHGSGVSSSSSSNNNNKNTNAPQSFVSISKEAWDGTCMQLRSFAPTMMGCGDIDLHNAKAAEAAAASVTFSHVRSPTTSPTKKNQFRKNTHRVAFSSKKEVVGAGVTRSAKRKSKNLRPAASGIGDDDEDDEEDEECDNASERDSFSASTRVINKKNNNQSKMERNDKENEDEDDDDDEFDEDDDDDDVGQSAVTREETALPQSHEQPTSSPSTKTRIRRKSGATTTTTTEIAIAANEGENTETEDKKSLRLSGVSIVSSENTNDEENEEKQKNFGAKPSFASFYKAASPTKKAPVETFGAENNTKSITNINNNNFNASFVTSPALRAILNNNNNSFNINNNNNNHSLNNVQQLQNLFASFALPSSNEINNNNNINNQSFLNFSTMMSMFSNNNKTENMNTVGNYSMAFGAAGMASIIGLPMTTVTPQDLDQFIPRDDFGVMLLNVANALTNELRRDGVLDRGAITDRFWWNDDPLYKQRNEREENYRREMENLKAEAENKNKNKKKKRKENQDRTGFFDSSDDSDDDDDEQEDSFAKYEMKNSATTPAFSTPRSNKKNNNNNNKTENDNNNDDDEDQDFGFVKGDIFVKNAKDNENNNASTSGLALPVACRPAPTSSLLSSDRRQSAVPPALVPSLSNLSGKNGSRSDSKNNNSNSMRQDDEDEDGDLPLSPLLTSTLTPANTSSFSKIQQPQLDNPNTIKSLGGYFGSGKTYYEEDDEGNSSKNNNSTRTPFQQQKTRTAVTFSFDEAGGNNKNMSNSASVSPRSAGAPLSPGQQLLREFSGHNGNNENSFGASNLGPLSSPPLSPQPRAINGTLNNTLSPPSLLSRDGSLGRNANNNNNNLSIGSDRSNGKDGNMQHSPSDFVVVYRRPLLYPFNKPRPATVNAAVNGTTNFSSNSGWVDRLEATIAERGMSNPQLPSRDVIRQIRKFTSSSNNNNNGNSRIWTIPKSSIINIEEEILKRKFLESHRHHNNNKHSSPSKPKNNNNNEDDLEHSIFIGGRGTSPPSRGASPGRKKSPSQKSEENLNDKNHHRRKHPHATILKKVRFEPDAVKQRIHLHQQEQKQQELVSPLLSSPPPPTSSANNNENNVSHESCESVSTIGGTTGSRKINNASTASKKPDHFGDAEWEIFLELERKMNQTKTETETKLQLHRQKELEKANLESMRSATFAALESASDCFSKSSFDSFGSNHDDNDDDDDDDFSEVHGINNKSKNRKHHQEAKNLRLPAALRSLDTQEHTQIFEEKTTQVQNSALAITISKRQNQQTITNLLGGVPIWEKVRNANDNDTPPSSKQNNTFTASTTASTPPPSSSATNNLHSLRVLSSVLSTRTMRDADTKRRNGILKFLPPSSSPPSGSNDHDKSTDEIHRQQIDALDEEKATTRLHRGEVFHSCSSSASPLIALRSRVGQSQPPAGIPSAPKNLFYMPSSLLGFEDVMDQGNIIVHNYVDVQEQKGTDQNGSDSKNATSPMVVKKKPITTFQGWGEARKGKLAERAGVIKPNNAAAAPTKK